MLVVHSLVPPDRPTNRKIESQINRPFYQSICLSILSGCKLGDRFREHLLDVKTEDQALSKLVARLFNFSGHSHEHMEICGINLHFGNETRKRKEQRLIFKLGTLASNGIA